MKEYDEYQQLINNIANFAIKNHIEPQMEYISKILEKSDDIIRNSINKAIELRSTLGFINNEVENFHAVLNAGSQLYTNFKDIDAAFCVSYDVSCIVNRYNLEQECEPYKRTNSIFQSCPDLYKLVSDNEEMINITNMENKPYSRILKYKNENFKISNRLNPILIDYLKQKYMQNILWARVDKDNYGENTREYITEAVLRSEKSGWYKNLKIFTGENKKGCYSFPETFARLGFSKKEADKLMEDGYKEKEQFVLQTFFKRDNSGLLSGSIEELAPVKCDNVLIAKYLHLTSSSPINTTWEEASLAHIDGAINVYFDEKAKSRLLKHLDEKVDANCRTHLFRIDNIPITELFTIAKLFFKGLCLIEEWEEDSFQL